MAIRDLWQPLQTHRFSYQGCQAVARCAPLAEDKVELRIEGSVLGPEQLLSWAVCEVTACQTRVFGHEPRSGFEDHLPRLDCIEASWSELTRHLGIRMLSTIAFGIFASSLSHDLLRETIQVAALSGANSLLQVAQHLRVLVHCHRQEAHIGVS